MQNKNWSTAAKTFRIQHSATLSTRLCSVCCQDIQKGMDWPGCRGAQLGQEDRQISIPPETSHESQREYFKDIQTQAYTEICHYHANLVYVFFLSCWLQAHTHTHTHTHTLKIFQNTGIQISWYLIFLTGYPSLFCRISVLSSNQSLVELELICFTGNLSWDTYIHL